MDEVITDWTRHAQRRAALREMLARLALLDDDSLFERLGELSRVSGFTSLARDVRMIRDRIAVVRLHAKQHAATLHLRQST